MTPVWIMWCDENPDQCNTPPPTILTWALTSITLGILLLTLTILIQERSRRRKP